MEIHQEEKPLKIEEKKEINEENYDSSDDERPLRKGFNVESTLKEDQIKKYKIFAKAAHSGNKDGEILEDDKEEKMEPTKEEIQWMDPMCLVRYLKAREWNLEKSYKMLKESIKWRRETRPDQISIKEVKEIQDLGGMYINGIDKFGRPIIYVKPGAYNPYPADQRVKYLMFTLEKALRMMDSSQGVEKMCWILDFAEYGSRAKSPEGKQVSKNSMAVLQNHYPERLGACFIINSPWYFSALYTIVSPFLHANTKKKIKWVSGKKEDIFKVLSDTVDADQLEEQYGGRKLFKFHPEEEYKRDLEREEKLKKSGQQKKNEGIKEVQTDNEKSIQQQLGKEEARDDESATLD